MNGAEPRGGVMGNRGGGVKRTDARGRMKETRHGTKHFTTWRPARGARSPARRAKKPG